MVSAYLDFWSGQGQTGRLYVFAQSDPSTRTSPFVVVQTLQVTREASHVRDMNLGYSLDMSRDMVLVAGAKRSNLHTWDGGAACVVFVVWRACVCVCGLGRQCGTGAVLGVHACNVQCSVFVT